ncbi:MAG: GNAT family protein [Candidatus Izemoplasmatales bacterium]|nr:GNAT family protein [Candidatus Izemoplasmatales bacterium]
MRLLISETQAADLTSIKMLWADGDVMRYVGFPEGLKQSDQQMEQWLKWIVETPHTQHYTLKADDLGFVGESFYQLRSAHTEAIIDIKLLKKARGKALGERALCFTLDQLFLNTPALLAVVDPHCENLGAIALYHKLGFQDDELFAYENEPHQKMILTKDNWRRLRLEQVHLEPIDKHN